VDDSEDLREVLTFLIEDAGFDVVTAANGREALEYLHAGLRPCAILLDLLMPAMDGLAFRRAQLADPDLRDVPVAVISVTGTFYEEQARALGISTFLRKPFSVEDVLALVAHHCAQAG
jgi:CheY-like chemotaxis protein